MKKRYFLVGACILSFLVGCSNNKDLKSIGIIQLAEHDALDSTRKGFIDGLAKEGFKDGENIKITYKNAQGEKSSVETIANKLVNDKSDLIFAIATPAAQAVAQKTQDIPIVVSAVTDPAYAKLVKSNENPGTNVTGTSDLTPVADQIKLLKEMIPNAQKVAILYANDEDNSRLQADLAKKAIEAEGMKWQDATVSDLSQIQQVVQSLVGKVDAIYIPTDNTIAEGMTTVSMITNKNGIPTIVGERALVVKGGLATKGVDYYQLGYSAGLQAAKILRNEAKPANMPIEYMSEDQLELVINQSVADQLKIDIPKALLEKAEIVK